MHEQPQLARQHRLADPAQPRLATGADGRRLI
jgi:hypothetical protein